MTSESFDKAAAIQARRRRLQREAPAFCCPQCSSLVYDGEEECFECDLAQPANGWLPVDVVDDPWLGRILADRYLVSRIIAERPSSSVYRADSRVIPRSFALKILRTHEGESFERGHNHGRFRRDLESLSSIRNTHIAAYYDVFEPEAGHVVVVMDLLEGRTLDVVVRQSGRQPVERAINIARQLASGLGEAHAGGVAHRHLRPRNVMVESLPAGDDFVKILDFGLAAIRESMDHRPGDILFSPPEELRGESTGLPADVWALGATLFLALTGASPYERRQDPDSILRLSEAADDVEFPAGLEDLVFALTHPDPAQRPSDLDAIIADFDAVTAGERPTRSTLARVEAVGREEEVDSPPFMEAGELSQVSEAEVEVRPEVAACSAENYGFIAGETFRFVRGEQTAESVPIELPAAPSALALCRDCAVIGTEAGHLCRLDFDGTFGMQFQDPRGDAIRSISITIDGSSAVAGSASGRIYGHMGLQRGAWNRIPHGAESGEIDAVALSAKGQQFAVARNGNIQSLSLTKVETAPPPIPVAGRVVSMAFSPDDYLIAILIEGGTVQLLGVLTGQEFLRLDTKNPNIVSVAFSPENNLMGLVVDGDKVTLNTLT